MKDIFKVQNWKAYGWLCLLVCLFSSCLSDGEETIALEQGDSEVLVQGTWVVDQVRMYDSGNHAYLSDLPEHEWNRVVWVFEAEGQGYQTAGDGNRTQMTWALSENDDEISIAGGYYALVSLGKGKMVLEQGYTSPEGEPVILRLVLIKTASPEQAEEEVERDHTSVVSSSQAGVIGADGVNLTIPYGAVPKNSQGQDGQVAFSIQSSDGLPAQLPEGMQSLSGNGYRIEPMNFVFNSPLTLEVPLNGVNVNNVGLLRYNEYTGGWDEIPFSSVNGTTSATASVLELGEFVLVEKSASGTTGGLHIPASCLEQGYYYYLTLTSANDGNEVERIAFAADGKDLFMSNIPLGTYICTISREARGSLDTPSQGVETSLWTGTVTINTPLNPGSGGFNTYSGWYEFTAFKNADWSTGRPNEWGEVTVTYGTGEFQATLTWVNTTSSATDYDLHLYGPNSMHVFFGTKSSGTFELDRDWLTGAGNAIENIYSISENLLPGTYQVKVHHYSGALGKRYNCRIIVNGVVVKSTSGSISANGTFDDIYTFTLE